MNGTLNSLSASTGSLVNPFPHAARESDTETGLYLLSRQILRLHLRSLPRRGSVAILFGCKFLPIR